MALPSSVAIKSPQFPAISWRLAESADCAPLFSACYSQRDWSTFAGNYAIAMYQQLQKRCIILVGEEDAGIIASGQLHLFGKVAEFANLSVTKTRRNQGIGEALIKALIEISRQSGVKQIEIGISADNPRPRALYERLGFRHSRRVSLPHSGKQATIFQMEL